MTWLEANMGNIIVLALVGALLYVCAASLIKSKRNGLPSCACGKNCATCALRYAHGMAHKKA
ncbi:MAG: FeoB-associated Cys-rich membrane protein [Erysipelotrichaceae bacterium]|jgi:hypothetical protein|nr:FeoB-associated Cys-rich membrane protein [Erysipelotrichaceae bacterium]MBQ6217153.1 FeoB-associated Cys-rich membrane protein [Erysipelotrichaceae bacterium]MBR6233764.1 FeoB-associated Cys-rich membrane protein [Erysipelotrichaceae bacterium]